MILALMMFLIAAIMIGSVIERQRADIIIEKTVHNSIGSVSCDCSKNIEEIQKGLIEINSNLTKLELKSEFETEEIVGTSIGDQQQKIEIPQGCELPNISTNIKLFTDYRYYDLWYTPHYRLQQEAWTDELGFRRFNEDYIVALGSYYSTNIGDRFEVTLDTGTVFTVILGDGKWDADCDPLCMYTPCIDYDGCLSGNLLEFIVDDQVLDKEVYEYGSLDMLQQFKGSIIKMVYLGRDDSADWDTYETNSRGGK